jgi:hypothetical protein
MPSLIEKKAIVIGAGMGGFMAPSETTPNRKACQSGRAIKMMRQN